MTKEIININININIDEWISIILLDISRMSMTRMGSMAQTMDRNVGPRSKILLLCFVFIDIIHKNTVEKIKNQWEKLQEL